MAVLSGQARTVRGLGPDSPRPGAGARFSCLVAGRSARAQGRRRIAGAIDEVHRRTRGVAVRIDLETTAGQGTCLGHRFEHLGRIMDSVAEPERLVRIFTETPEGRSFELSPGKFYDWQRDAHSFEGMAMYPCCGLRELALTGTGTARAVQ